MRNPPGPHYSHSTGAKTGRYRHGNATGGLHPVLALRNSDTAMVEPTSPRKTRPRYPKLDAAHEVIRALSLQSRGRDLPPPEDTDTDFDLELIPDAPAGGAPAAPTPPTGSMQALCPAMKRGRPRQHPRSAASDDALPAVGYAAARAAPRYGVARGWIQDETTHGSVNIQEAVDRVANTGQTEVALHTRGRHGGPAKGIVVEPTGMVLVLAADIV